MKTALPIFICTILAAGCCLVGFLVTDYINWPESNEFTENYQTVEYNTPKANEADTTFANKGYFRVLSTYECKVKNKQGDKTPWADVLVCEVHYKSVLRADTILMLNINRGEEYSGPDDSGAYIPFTEFTERYEKCYVRIPENQLSVLNRYKFTYGNVNWYLECGNQ